MTEPYNHADALRECELLKNRRCAATETLRLRAAHAGTLRDALRILETVVGKEDVVVTAAVNVAFDQIKRVVDYLEQ